MPATRPAASARSARGRSSAEAMNSATAAARQTRAAVSIAAAPPPESSESKSPVSISHIEPREMKFHVLFKQITSVVASIYIVTQKARAVHEQLSAAEAKFPALGKC